MSEHSWTVNKLRAQKHCSNLHNSTFSYFLMSLEGLKLEKSLLVVSEILSFFVNVLTNDEKYCLSVETSI